MGTRHLGKAPTQKVGEPACPRPCSQCLQAPSILWAPGPCPPHSRARAPTRLLRTCCTLNRTKSEQKKAFRDSWDSWHKGSLCLTWVPTERFEERGGPRIKPKPPCAKTACRTEGMRLLEDCVCSSTRIDSPLLCEVQTTTPDSLLCLRPMKTTSNLTYQCPGRETRHLQYGPVQVCYWLTQRQQRHPIRPPETRQWGMKSPGTATEPDTLRT